MHWIKMHYACPQCTYRDPQKKNLQKEFDKCCVDKPENLMCKPNNETTLSCERYRFAFGEDEMNLNSDMGLYLKFDEVNGIPINCAGLDNFKIENWKVPQVSKSERTRDRRAYDQQCGLNMRREPATDQPMSTIIQEYAKDQAAWISDFVPAMEKMMRNGYTDSELTDAPASWDNVKCTEGDYSITCSVLAA